MKNPIVLSIVIVTTFTLLSLVATPVFSANTENAASQRIKKNDKPQHPQNRQRLPNTRAGKPPQQAIKVCLSKSENSMCRFQGPNSLENGACEFTPDKQYFACNPSRETITNKRVKQLPSHLANHQN